MEIYEVQPGDTLVSIANKFNLPYQKIAYDSNINPANEVVSGQIVLLAYPKQSYKVKQGDTWESIAETNGISIMQLLQNNPYLYDRNYLIQGEELVISYDKKENPIEVNAYTFSFIEANILKKALPFLTYITIAGYRVNVFGKIEAPNDSFIIQTAKEYGVAPIMMISTFTDQGKGSFGIAHKIFQDPELQHSLINNLAYLLGERGFYGINFAFNVVPEDLPGYVDFITQAKEILGSEGYQVFVTLAPKTFEFKVNDNNDNPYFSQIGQVADRVILLSYTWVSAYIPTFEQTTIPFLNSYVDYVITQIPPEKILLGYTRIAYDWELPYMEGESPVSSLANSQALDLAYQYGTDLGFDAYHVTPYFRYYTNGIEHFVWFKDARTFNAILDIVTEHNLRGVAISNTMDFTPQLWVTLNSQYNIIKVLDVTSDFFF